jgi:hypothetical protein
MMDQQERHRLEDALECAASYKNEASLWHEQALKEANRVGWLEAGLKEVRATVDDLLKALARIAAPLDCGCVPCCGQCRSQYALEIELEERQDIARAAIAKARES